MVDVEPSEVLILSEMVRPKTQFTFQFVAYDTNVLLVKLIDQEGNVLRSWQNAQEGEFTIEASYTAREVSIHFDNSQSTFSKKTVYFFMHHNVDFNFAADVKDLDPIEEKISEAASTMQRLQTLQVTLRTQQKNHRATVEDANERLLLWSVFQVVALVGMSGFQLFFLKRFLEKKTFV